MSVKPGLYQVRVAARHSKTGNIGKAIQWIDVPDLSSGRLAIGSLLLGERTKRDQTARDESENLEKARLKIDNRFTRQSQLRLLTYVYNGSHAVKGKTEIELEVQLQILRGDRTPLTSFVRELNAKGIEDLQRIPLAEELRLAALEPGSYFLRVSVHDQITGKSAERLIYFEVD